jgi:hypothetical protein
MLHTGIVNLKSEMEKQVSVFSTEELNNWPASRYNVRMSTTANPNLSYPIGKFSYQGPYTHDQRQHFIDEIAAAPERLRAAVHNLRESQLEAPYRPGGWTVQQVVHHLPDSHMNAFIRFKLALTEPNPTVKPYDEKLWAELADVQLPIETSLVLLEALHHRWVAVLRAMTPEQFEFKLKHPELGEVNRTAISGCTPGTASTTWRTSPACGKEWDGREAGCRLRAAGFGLRASGCRLRLRASGFGLQVLGFA